MKRDMRIVSVVLALLCTVALPRARLLRAREARQGHVPDVLRFQGAGSVRARSRDAAFLLVHRGAQGLRRGHPAGPELRDRVLGPRRQLSRELAGGGAVAERHRGRVGGAREGARDRGQDPARARLDRGDRRLLPRRRQGAAERPADRLHQGDGADDAALSGRLRGMDVLRPDPAGLRAEERQDLREPAQIGGDPGALVQAEPRAPRRGALPGPRLRLPAARRQGHHNREAIRAHRTGRPTRPAHAVTHLFDGGDVGRVDRLEPRRRSRSSPTTTTRPTSWSTLISSWAQDATAKALVDHGRGASPTGVPHPRELHGGRRDPGALRARARRLGRGGSATGRRRPAAPWPTPSSASPAGLGMARSGDLAGAQREIQALQELRGALEKSSQSYWADRTEEQILAVAAWVAYAEGAREQADEAHAGRRRRRGRQRQARGDGEPTVPDARVAR